MQAEMTMVKKKMGRPKIPDSEKMKMTSINLRQDDYKKLEIISEYRERRRSDIMREAIKEYLENHYKEIQGELYEDD